MPQTTQTAPWYVQLEGFLEAEAQKAKAEITKLYSEIEPVVIEYGEDFLASLAQIAMGAVLQQIPLLISGGEKFGAAVTETYQTLVAQGKPLAIQDAQLAVQAAYAKVQSTAAQAKAGG